MGDKRITSQDVANRAEVSRTTVSLVLNEVEGIRIPSSTREKVRRAAKELGYVPNMAARALASQRAEAIGLVMTRSPELISSDAFLPQILGGLLRTIKEHNFRLLIEIVEEDHNDNAYCELAQAKHIDGMIILTPRIADNGIRKLEEMNVPAVLLGSIPDCTLPSVDIDNYQGAYHAAGHLIESGHKEIACILNAPPSYVTWQDRQNGYRDTLIEAGLPYNEALVQYANFSPESGYKAMLNLLNNSVPFSAVFVASDNVAVGAYAALKDSGFHIPNDVSVIGFDDIPNSAFSDPPLTTVRVPAEKMASKACLLLLDLIKGKETRESKITFDTELIIRKSTKSYSDLH